MAPPSWLVKHLRTKDDGEKEVTSKRGKPQLLKLKFTPDTLQTGEKDYAAYGSFHISGPNFPPCRCKCMAVEGEVEVPAWRLEEYGDDSESDEAGDEEDERIDHSSPSSSDIEDAKLIPPPEQLAHERAFGHCAASASEDEDREPGEVVWEPETQDEEIAEQPLVQRPRGKHLSEEWIQAVEEGWVDKLPQVKGTTLARHSKSNAWSTKYPTKEGMRHFMRSFNTSTQRRSPFLALLQCMEWLVQQHYLKCGSHLHLLTELGDRRQVEEDLPCPSALEARQAFGRASGSVQV